MRGIQLNHSLLSDYDKTFLEEYHTAFGQGFVSSKYFILDEDTDTDGNLLDKRQKEIIMKTRKELAQWKLRQKVKKEQALIETKKYYENQKRELLLDKIKAEKHALFKSFLTTQFPCIEQRAYWRTYWNSYYASLSTHYSELYLYQDHELDVVYIDINDGGVWCV